MQYQSKQKQCKSQQKIDPWSYIHFSSTETPHCGGDPAFTGDIIQFIL